MSDSWILIALTILIIFLLFYMSKRLICSGPILTSSNEELGENQVDWSNGSPYYYDGAGGAAGESAQSGVVGSTHGHNNNPIMTICHSTNNNNNNNDFEEKTLNMSNSQMENRLRLQVLITHMILAEKEHKKLELEAARLARLLVTDQGSSSPEECVRNLRNELYPLTSFGNFQSQRLTPHQQRLLSSFPSTFNFVSEVNNRSKSKPDFDIIENELLPSDCDCPCRCTGAMSRSMSTGNNHYSIPNTNQISHSISVSDRNLGQSHHCNNNNNNNLNQLNMTGASGGEHDSILSTDDNEGCMNLNNLNINSHVHNNGNNNNTSCNTNSEGLEPVQVDAAENNKSSNNTNNTNNTNTDINHTNQQNNLNNINVPPHSTHANNNNNLDLDESCRNDSNNQEC